MSKDLILSMLVAMLAVIGHFGIWIALYNRFNATGWDRRTIKRVEKGVVLCCVMIPAFILLHEFFLHGSATSTFGNGRGLSNWHWTSIGYAAFTSSATIVLGPFWLRDRPQWSIDWKSFRVFNEREVQPVQQRWMSEEQMFPGKGFRWMSRLPGNQIGSLQCNTKELYIPSLPSSLQGLTIAHLSDVHLTGHMAVEYYRYAIDWIIEQQPEMVVLSGDIVDYESALGMLQPVLQGLSAPLGRYFVLGNHDRRLDEPSQITDSLCALGWRDAGCEEFIVYRNEAALRILGNERPWFSRHKKTLSEAAKSSNTLPPNAWTLGIAHSPDQWKWGVANRCGLLLCGHTHGGQIRFPIIGPVIAPSWYGSRYASGVFRHSHTMMHVSRGVSGVHPFRWGCTPEVSILRLITPILRNR